MLGIVSAATDKAQRMNRSIIIACLIYFVLVIRKVLEPQKDHELRTLKSQNFTYLMILDVESR
jgi:hypothetical protein